MACSAKRCSSSALESGCGAVSEETISTHITYGLMSGRRRLAPNAAAAAERVATRIPGSKRERGCITVRDTNKALLQNSGWKPCQRARIQRSFAVDRDGAERLRIVTGKQFASQLEKKHRPQR